MATRINRRVHTSVIRESKYGVFVSNIDQGSPEVRGHTSGSVLWAIESGLTIRTVVADKYQPAFYGPLV